MLIDLKENGYEGDKLEVKMDEDGWYACLRENKDDIVEGHVDTITWTIVEMKKNELPI